MAKTLTKAAWIAGLAIGIAVASGFYVKTPQNLTVATISSAATITPLNSARTHTDSSPQVPLTPVLPPKSFDPSNQQVTVATPQSSSLPFVATNQADRPPRVIASPQASVPNPNASPILTPQARLDAAPVAVPKPAQAAHLDPALTQAKTAPALAHAEAVIVTAPRPQQMARVDVESLSRGNSLTIQLPKRRK
jgi:hypothetical protein